MGIYAAWFRFSGEPPTRDEIDRQLVARAGETRILAGYRRERSEVMILTSIEGVAVAYARKVMRDLGGTQLDFNTREPSDEPLEAFVETAWFEHDEATRQTILDELARERERYK